MKLLSLVFASILCLSATANAGLLVEPYAGYGFGKFNDKTTPSKGDVSGGAIGARLGGTFTMVFVAADLMTTISGKTKYTSGNTGSFDTTNTAVYADVGVDLPVIRAWGGYGIVNNLTIKTPIGDEKLSGGSHFKLGVGFHVIPMLSLNVEYLVDTFKKAKVGALSGTTDTTANEVLLTASVPFSF